jgi:uncharacterized protein (TIGR00297 family)
MESSALQHDLMPARVAAGLVVAAVIALAAWRAGSLSRSGAVGALAVGGASVAGGWSAGALLILYFLATVSLTRLGAREKERRTSGMHEKAGARDAVQVAANGGAFALLALQAALLGGSRGVVAAAAAAGALAASAADTFATEIGTLAGGAPWSLATGRRVAAGTSGGVSVAGTLAMIAGALFVALAALALGVSRELGAVALGGVSGALADSLLGATAQERRWCTPCARATERRVHDCGTTTSLVGGVGWMDNDVVNLLATVIGAAVAGALAAF